MSVAWVFWAVLLVAAFIICALELLGRYCIGCILKMVAKRVARKQLGMRIDIGALRMSLLRAKITGSSLVIYNPVGWSSEYLLRADRVMLNLSMRWLLCYGFRQVLVQQLILEDLDLIWEKRGYGESNVNEVLKQLENVLQFEKDPGDDETNALVPQPNSKSSVTLREVSITGVGARLASRTVGAYGPRVALADLHFRNFSEEHRCSDASETAGIILRTLLKSAVASSGQVLSAAASVAVNGLQKAGQWVVGMMK